MFIYLQVVRDDHSVMLADCGTADLHHRYTEEIQMLACMVSYK